MSRANLTKLEHIRGINESARIRRNNRLVQRTPMHYSARLDKRERTEKAKFSWWIRVVGYVVVIWQKLMRKISRRPAHYKMTLDQLKSLQNHG